MNAQIFSYKTHFPLSAEQLFSWHERPGALEYLLVPWQKVAILKNPPGLKEGKQVHLRVRLGPLLWRRMEVEHINIIKGRCFSDIQRRGPFAHWLHEHHCHPKGDNQSVLEDRIRYRLPLGRIGEWIAGGGVQEELKRVFRYRHEKLYKDLVTHTVAADPTLRCILVSGARGLVGRALVPYLCLQGHRVVQLSRTPGVATLHWEPEKGVLDFNALNQCAPDAVVHLAGEPIAQRWTTAAKQRILNSRVQGTRLLSERLAALRVPPKVLVCASGISIYGTNREEAVDETADVHCDGFLGEVAQEWEAATAPAVQAGIRVVHLRLGVVLSPGGGALAKMLPAFRIGLGGPSGSGTQRLSWIALDDVIGAFYHCLVHTNLQGAVNATAPQNVSNAQFASELASALGHKARLKLPRLLINLLLGEMGTETLLASQNVRPCRLQETGYRFRYPEIDHALVHLLGR